MASAVIGALRVDLGINTAQFNEGLKGVRASMDKVGRQFQQFGGKMSTYVTAPLSVAGAAVTAAVTTMARDVEELQKAAQISNAGFEQFQRLAHAARSVGIESDKLADIYKDVNDRVGDFMATGGGPMADFFENIAPKVGITAEAFKNLSGPEALQLYYDSLVKAGASQQDMTFYLEAMASDTTALIPLLRDGGKAFEEMGRGAAVLSEQDAASLQQYNNSIRQMGEAVKALTIALVNTGILETLTGIVDRVSAWVTALADVNPALVRWSAIVAGIGAAVGPVAIGVGLLVTAMAAVAAPVWAAVAAIAAVAAGITALWQGIQIAHPWLQKISGEVWDAITTKVAEAKAAIQQFALDVVAALQALPGQMIQIGKDMMAGLVQGIKAAPGMVKDALVGVVSSAYQGAKDFLGIKSPSRLFAEMGEFIMQGLGQGMESMSSDVTNVASGISQTVSNAFQGLIDGSKTVKDVISDLIGKLSEMFINQGFQALLGGGIGGGGGGGLFGSVFGGLGKLLGFANGGSFQVGGAGGIDSQLVAFKASPNERVTVTKPGQEGGGRDMHITVGVAADGNGNIKPFVQDVARGEAAAVSRASIQSYDKQLSNTWAQRSSMAQQRQG